MRKVVVSEYVTLDGVIEAPEESAATAETIREGDAARDLLAVARLYEPRARGRHLRPGRDRRSVVERRRQIGMMRTLGLQRGQVRLPLLIESSFVALLSIGAGVAMASGFPGMEYTVPWSALVLVIVVGYAASLLTTSWTGRSEGWPGPAIRT